jgi:hypothetical protein
MMYAPNFLQDNLVYLLHLFPCSRMGWISKKATIKDKFKGCVYIVFYCLLAELGPEKGIISKMVSGDKKLE